MRGFLLHQATLLAQRFQAQVEGHLDPSVNFRIGSIDPIRKQFIPVGNQLIEVHPMLTLDSLYEQKDSLVSGLTHRYGDFSYISINQGFNL